jgi:hypothetical protein
MVKIIDDIRITVYNDGSSRKLELASEKPRHPEYIVKILRQAIYCIRQRKPIMTAVQEGAG